MKYAMALLFFSVLWASGTAATITYTYDAQHRLVQASYSASEKAFYNYDAAGNVDVHITITDEQYLKPFLYWLSGIVPEYWLPGAKT